MSQMKPRLNIITPCSRDYNLQALYNSIVEANAKGNFDVSWYIVVDRVKLPRLGYIQIPIGKLTSIVKAGEGGSFGNRLRNMALDIISSGWVMFLDDDNMVHPEMLDVLWYHTTKYEGAHAFIFNTSVGPNGKEHVRTRMDGIAPDHIDTAQFVVSRHLIGEERWDETAYNADGIFITDLYKRGKETFVLIDGTVYYNALNKGGK